MTEINYKSDFDFVLCLCDTDGVEMQSLPEHDFEVRITTGKPRPYAKEFVASRKAGECAGMYEDNGRAHIVCDNHGLDPGELWATVVIWFPDERYPDGVRTTQTSFSLGIRLTETGPKELDTSPTVEAYLPFVAIDAYKMAQSNGFKGSYSRYLRSITPKKGQKPSPYISRKIISINSVKGSVYINRGLFCVAKLYEDRSRITISVGRIAKMLGWEWSTTKEKLLELFDRRNIVSRYDSNLDAVIAQTYTYENYVALLCLELGSEYADFPYLTISKGGVLVGLNAPGNKTPFKPAPPVESDLVMIENVYPWRPALIATRKKGIEVEKLRKKKRIWDYQKNKLTSTSGDHWVKILKPLRDKGFDRPFSSRSRRHYTLLRARVKTKRGNVSDWVYWHLWSTMKIGNNYIPPKMYFSGTSDRKIYYRL